MTDEERDAHLRAALRHAPDAQLRPPPALSELILKEARAKARDAAPPAHAPRRRLLGIWDRLARPSVATGFAGVMVATLIGLMWWDQPMDEAMPRPPVPAATPAPAVTAPPAVPVAEAPPPAPAPEPTHAPQRKSAPAAKPAAAAAPAPEAALREEAAAPAMVGAAQPAREAAPPVALAAPPPAPAPAAAADTATAGAGALSQTKSFDEAKRQRSMAPADTMNKAKAEARETEARSSIAPVRAAIAAEPARWGWQRSGAAAQGMSDAVVAWLAQLESATGTRWQSRAGRDTATPLGRELRLLRDGRVQHSLRLSERGVSCDSGQSALHVELTAGQLAELQAALEQAAP